MNNHYYPDNLSITIKDFTDSGWKKILSQAPRQGYQSMYQTFSAAARAAIEKGNNEQGKALWLLADACSMTLKPSSQNEPFMPFFIMNERRSAIPEDLSEADIEFFAEVVDAIDDIWLQARLADLLWLKKLQEILHTP